MDVCIVNVYNLKYKTQDVKVYYENIDGFKRS